MRKQKITLVVVMLMFFGTMIKAEAFSLRKEGKTKTEEMGEKKNTKGFMKSLGNFFKDSPDIQSKNFNKKNRRLIEREKKLVNKGGKKREIKKRIEIKESAEIFEQLTKEEKETFFEKIKKLEKKKNTKVVDDLKKELKKQKKSFKSILKKVEKGDDKEAESKIKKQYKKELKKRYDLLKKLNEEQKKDLEKVLKTEFTEEEQKLIEVEPDYLMELQDIEINDTRYEEQWSLEFIGDEGFALEMEAGSEQEKPIIAVIDTGFDLDHPELINSWWGRSECYDVENQIIEGGCPAGYDVVDEDTNPEDEQFSHGTAVSGLIGAATNNNTGIASFSNNQVEIMPIRACSDDGYFRVSDIAEAIYFAVNNGADIINMSFGGPTPSETIRNAMLYAQDHGVVMTIASGNYGQDNDVNPIYPASYPNINNIISVGAYDSEGYLASFSNYGATTVDLLAPGVNVLTTTTNGNTRTYNGTSFSAPLTASALVRYMIEGGKAENAKVRILNDSNSYVSLQSFVINGKRLEFGEKQEELVEIDILSRLKPEVNMREFLIYGFNHGYGPGLWEFEKEDVEKFLEKQPGRLKNVRTKAHRLDSGDGYIYDPNRSFSWLISQENPKYQLALMELYKGAVTDPNLSDEEIQDMYGYKDLSKEDLEKFDKEYPDGWNSYRSNDPTIDDFRFQIDLMYKKLGIRKNELEFKDGDSVNSSEYPLNGEIVPFTSLESVLAELAENREQWEHWAMTTEPGSFFDVYNRLFGFDDWNPAFFKKSNIPLEDITSLSVVPVESSGFFLKSPYDKSLKGCGINSFFDHRYPTFNKNQDQKLNFFLGKEYTTSPLLYGYNSYDSHSGYDFLTRSNCATNTNSGYTIKASHSGLLEVKLEQDNGYGKHVYIRHYNSNNENDYTTVYAHLDSIIASDGQIEAGEVIGIAGSSGASTTTHLHFEVWRYLKDGATTKIASIDPMGWWEVNQNDPWDGYINNELPIPEIPIFNSIGTASSWLWESDSLVDDKDSSFWRFGGQTKPWSTNETGGYDGRSFYTTTVNNNDWKGWAFWGLKAPSAGMYKVQVYVPTPEVGQNVSTEAQYYIYYEDINGIKHQTNEITIDQKNNVGWVDLGTYSINVGQNKIAVQLVDEVSSADQEGKIIFADAVRLVQTTPPEGFPDVNIEDWFYDYVTEAKDSGIIEGHPDGTYKPANQVNRAEGIKMLSEALGLVPQDCTNGENVYEDVSEGQWFCPYVKAAKTKNVLGDFIINNHFNPSASMSRKEVMLMLSRLKEVPIENDNKTNCYTTESEPVNRNLYEDLENLSSNSQKQIEQKNSIIWPSHAEINISSVNIHNNLVHKKLPIIEGRKKEANGDRKFVPNDFVNRAEMAKIVINARDFFDSNTRDIAACVSGGGTVQSMEGVSVLSTTDDTFKRLGSFYEQPIDFTNTNAPTVNLGGNQTINEGETISFYLPQTDTDGDIIHYAWFSSNGTFNAIDNIYYRNIEWTAPEVDTTQEVSLSIIAQDGRGKVGYDDITITVQNTVTQPPTTYDYQTVHDGDWSNSNSWQNGIVPENGNKSVLMNHWIDMDVNVEIDTMKIGYYGRIRKNNSGEGIIRVNKIFNYGDIEKTEGGLTIVFNEEFQNHGNIEDKNIPETVTAEVGEIETLLFTINSLDIHANGFIYNTGLWKPAKTKIMDSTTIGNTMDLEGDLIFNLNHPTLNIESGVELTVNSLGNFTTIGGDGSLIVKGDSLDAEISLPIITFKAESGERNTISGGFISDENGTVIFSGSGTKILKENKSDWGEMYVKDGIVELETSNFTVQKNLRINSGAWLQNKQGQDVDLQKGVNGVFINVNSSTVRNNSAGGNLYYEGNPNPSTCIPPTTGDWIPTESCIMDETSTAQGNVIINPNIVITIPNGMTLFIDLHNHNLTVKNGGGLLIKHGGTVKQSP